MALSSAKKQSNELIKLSVTLFGITFVVAALLAVVNFFTAPKIAKTSQQKLEQSMKEVLPDAVTFEDITAEVTAVWADETPVLSVQAAKNSSGSVIGYCVEVAPEGYSDQIDMMVGINTEGEITDTDIISISDTPGVGTQVEKAEFTDQFVGKSGVLTAIKGSSAAANEVLLISGATYSSTGFSDGVNAALRVYEIVAGEGVK